MKVLVAEDDPNIRKGLVEILASAAEFDALPVRHREDDVLQRLGSARRGSSRGTRADVKTGTAIANWLPRAARLALQGPCRCRSVLRYKSRESSTFQQLRY